MAERTVTAAVQDGRVAMLSPEGEPVWMDQSGVEAAVNSGYTPETTQAMKDRRAAEQAAEEFDSPGLAALAGLGRGMTFGLSDVAMTGTGMVEPDTLAKLREHNPAASEGANLIGLLGSSMIPGGPLARLGSLGGKLAGGSRLGAMAAGAAAEGAGISAGETVSDLALSEEPVTVDRAIDAVRNAGAGAAVNAGLSLAGVGLTSLLRFAGSKQKALFNKMQKAQSNQLYSWQRRLKSQADRVRLRDQLDDQILKATKEDEAIAALGAIDGSGGRTVAQTPRAKGAKGKGATLEKLRKRKARLEEKIYKSKMKGDVSDNLDELNAQLERATKQLDDRKRNLVASMSSRAGERYLAHSVGGALGGMLGAGLGPMGGIGGFALGGAVGAAVANRVRAYVRPIVHDVVKSKKFKEAAAKTAYGAGKAVMGVGKAAKTLTVKEFSQLQDQLKEAPDAAGLAELTMGSLPPDLPTPIRSRVANQQAAAMDVIKQYIPPSNLDMQEIPMGRKRKDPGIAARRQVSRVAQAVMDPESAIENFALGRLSLEEAVVLDRVYRDEVEDLRQMVVEQVEYARSQGQGFSRHRAEQIRRFLGRGLPTPGARSSIPSQSMVEEKRGPGRPPSQKAPRVAGQYDTTFGSVGGRIFGRMRNG